MYALCDTGAVSDVRRSDHTVSCNTGRSRMHESESRVCRISPEPAGRESVQSSGGAYHRSARRRVQRDDDRVLPGASGTEEDAEEGCCAGASGRLHNDMTDSKIKAPPNQERLFDTSGAFAFSRNICLNRKRTNGPA